MTKKITCKDLLNKKSKNQKISALTCYDSTMASILNKTKGIDLVLVGDSLGNVMMGYENTINVTIDNMITYTKSVKNALHHSLLAADLPFLSFHESSRQCFKNARDLIQKAGAESLKIEGCTKIALDAISLLSSEGIPVIGHLGLTPQSILKDCSYGVRGNDSIQQKHLINSSKKIQDAGAYMLVLEMVNPDVSEKITKSLSIPVIGIGSGNKLDGQILVLQDLLGMNKQKIPKFVKQYADLETEMIKALNSYIEDVNNS